MNEGFIFREMCKNEVPVVFDLILSRIQWMDERRIKSWNTTNYTERYPISYYLRKTEQHEMFALVDQETDRILCAGVLKQEDDRWQDKHPAIYVHNLVSAIDVKGAGSVFLRFAEDYARSIGKDYLRLDSIEGNPKITAYYERLGFCAAGKCTDGDYHGILREKRLNTMTKECCDLLEQTAGYAEAYVSDAANKRAFPEEKSIAALSVFDEPLPEEGKESVF